MANAQPHVEFSEERLNAFIGKVLGDLGGLASAPLVRIGDRLGLYDALAEAPATSAELAERTGTAERYVREWLLNQAAGGYIEYDPATDRYGLPPEHAAALPNLLGGFQLLLAAVRSEERIADAFRTGAGIEWGDHHIDLYEGCERFFRPGYEQLLTSTWIPALDGVEAKLQSGGTVADLGCGHGASTILMAHAYPQSTFVGFDNHEGSIIAAREAAETAGVADRVSFEVADATSYPAPDRGYDLIAFFDSLHDMGDPVGACRQACGAVAPEGVAMFVEPLAGEHVEDNLNPVGRLYAAGSTLLCTPNSLAANGPALGAQASEAQLRAVAEEGGFTRFRRASEGPFNRVFEAKR